jgi:hypothetical protein
MVLVLPVLRIHEILVRIRIRGPKHLINGPGPDPDPDADPDPAIFVSDLQDINKKIIFQLFCFLLFEGTFTPYFSKKKNS